MHLKWHHHHHHQSIKCPSCNIYSFSEFVYLLVHIDKEVDHNQMKYDISYPCSICQLALTSQSGFIQYFTDCASMFAKGLGIDSLSVFNLSTPNVTNVFFFNDEDWEVSINEDVYC